MKDSRKNLPSGRLNAGEGCDGPLEGMLCTLLLEHLPKESNGGSSCGNFQMRILHNRLLFFHTEARS